MATARASPVAMSHCCAPTRWLVSRFAGYYVTKGKISSSGSQATPEQDIHWTCGGTAGYYGCQPVVVDGPQDDGSYGAGDPGIFFFLTNGTKVVTSLDYIQTDQPIPGIAAPKLGG